MVEMSTGTSAELKINTEEPIFIVACPRSGTTILATLLNNHSKIAAATETHFFNYVARQKKYDWKSFDLKQLAEFLDESRITDFFTVANLSKEDFIALFEEKFKLDPKQAEENKRQVFNLLIEELCQAKGKERFCEKTPQHLQNIEEILRLYPRAKIINLVRDGRDTVNSLLKMPWRPDGLINNSRFWQQNINAGLKVESLLKKKNQDTENLLSLRYEDLLVSPKETMRKVLSFIGLDFEDSVLSPNNEVLPEDGLAENIFSDWESSWKHKSLEEIDSTRIGVWQKEMSDQDQLIINWHMKKTLLQLGYPVQEENGKLAFADYLRVAREYVNLFARKIVRVISQLVN